MEMSVHEKLLDILESLRQEELKSFQWFLQKAKLPDGFNNIKTSKLEKADRLRTVDLMVEMYSDKVMEVVDLILQKTKGSKGQ